MPKLVGSWCAWCSRPSDMLTVVCSKAISPGTAGFSGFVAFIASILIRSEASVIGCTQSFLNGISLTNENDNQTYMIIPGSTPVQPGDRVELKGVVAVEGSGNHSFRVQSLVKNYGTCGPASAGIRVAQNSN